jgi:hypothetical protein
VQNSVRINGGTGLAEHKERIWIGGHFRFIISCRVISSFVSEWQKIIIMDWWPYLIYYIVSCNFFQCFVGPTIFI